MPYRNSTLTHMLQDSLEKDSKTLMFGCISPAAFNSEESVCTLNWAARARKVELGKVRCDAVQNHVRCVPQFERTPLTAACRIL